MYRIISYLEYSVSLLFLYLFESLSLSLSFVVSFCFSVCERSLSLSLSLSLPLSHTHTRTCSLFYDVAPISISPSSWFRFVSFLEFTNYDDTVHRGIVAICVLRLRRKRLISDIPGTYVVFFEWIGTAKIRVMLIFACFVNFI